MGAKIFQRSLKLSVQVCHACSVWLRNYRFIWYQQHNVNALWLKHWHLQSEYLQSVVKAHICTIFWFPCNRMLNFFWSLTWNISVLCKLRVKGWKAEIKDKRMLMENFPFSPYYRLPNVVISSLRKWDIGFGFFNHSKHFYAKI